MLRDEVNVVPPAQLRFDEFILKDQLPATVECNFRLDSPAKIRLELMTADNRRALMHGEPYDSIGKQPPAHSAISFTSQAATPSSSSTRTRPAPRKSI